MKAILCLILLLSFASFSSEIHTMESSSQQIADAIEFAKKAADKENLKENMDIYISNVKIIGAYSTHVALNKVAYDEDAAIIQEKCFIVAHSDVTELGEERLRCLSIAE